jgi:hypothetical protein
MASPRRALPTQSVPSDIYTWLLALACLFITFCNAFVALRLQADYAFFHTPSSTQAR